MIRNTKGYYTVEAAIFLPLLILSVLTIGYFIREAGARETVIHDAVDESRKLASRAYVQETALGFSSGLTGRILADAPEITSARIRGLSYRQAYEGNDGMIRFRIDYAVHVPLPLDRDRTMEREDRILVRSWIGRSRVGAAIDFDSMTGGGIVWVFPMSGKRYHRQDCTFVTNVPEQKVLTGNIAKHYKACETCHPGGLAMGSLVYCFPDYGQAYHRGGCKTIDKYTVTMTKNQAEERGYTPCAKCGGV